MRSRQPPTPKANQRSAARARGTAAAQGSGAGGGFGPGCTADGDCDSEPGAELLSDDWDWDCEPAGNELPSRLVGSAPTGFIEGGLKGSRLIRS